MKKIFKKLLLVSMSIIMILSVTACSDKVSVRIEEGDTYALSDCTDRIKEVLELSKQTSPDFAKGQRYKTPLKISTMRATSVTQKFEDGDGYEKNPYTELYKALYNIELKTEMKVNEKQYSEKMGYQISSGNLYDICQVDYAQLKLLMDNDQIWDLKEVYEKYATPEAKRTLESDPFTLSTVTFNGKMFAIPEGGDSRSTTDMLWVRKDLVDHINATEGKSLKIPTSMEEVITLAKGISDHNKSGCATHKSKIYGLGLSGKPEGAESFVEQWAGSAQGFFNGYGAYPDTWIEKDGKLVYGSVQPEMKTALAKLNELYEYGAINDGFAAKNPDNVGEDATSGSCGMFYGDWWCPTHPLWGMLSKNTPDVDWIPLALPKAGGGNVKSVAKVATSKFYVVSKKCQNPEAVVKMMNTQWEMERLGAIDAQKIWPIGNGGPRKNSDGTDAVGYDYWRLPLISVADAGQNYDLFNAISPCYVEDFDLSTIKNSKVRLTTKQDLDKWNEYGDKIKHFSSFGPEGGISILEYYRKNDLIQKNEYFGPVTETMADKDALLTDQENTLIQQMIVGDKSGADFDDFANASTGKWYKNGGNKITDEVNAWYNSRK